MSLRIYNTLNRKKEIFEPLKSGEVLMYVCGPTVYDNAHIGHAMSVLVFDIIRRYLEYREFDVHHVMNFTDIDDKIIRRANHLNVDPFELAEKYIQQFVMHLEELNVLPANKNPRATQEIPRIINMVKELVERGYAYEIDGDVYFRVTRDNDYGKLSGRKLDELVAGARVGVDERKENPMDFAVWKSAKNGEPSWDSPWGKGRPGWHIECSAMNMEHLGEQIDIHGGGTDLIFPHHENEIAQIESITEKPFAKYWVHNGMLQLGGEKMSKSLGNLITVEAFLKEHDSDVFRLIVLNSHYRNPLTYTEDVVVQAERALDRLRSALRPAFPTSEGGSEDMVRVLEDQMEASEIGFQKAMDDDFNTAGALGHLFELVRAINQARDAGVDDTQLTKAKALLKELTSVLGLKLEGDEKKETQVAPFIELLLEVRSELRKQKLWALSDKIRERMQELGISVEDSKEGSTWHWE